MKENINIGDYIRTNQGDIFRVEDTKAIYYILAEKNKNKKIIPVEEIKKNGKNIIDILEPNDIVYFKIKNLEHCNFEIIRESKIIYRSGKKALTINNYSLKQLEIISVLTHEQYKRNCYKLL